jgi:hypothetical protein
MAQQTAVEWLEAKLKTYCLLTISIKEDFEQAKAMEKEQMIEFFMKGQNTYPSEFVLDNKQIAEQHYNENYNK